MCFPKTSTGLPVSSFKFVDINNIGSMSQFLYTHNNSNYDDVEASKWQAAQVSTISLMSCSARIMIGRFFAHCVAYSPPKVTIGFISDFFKNKYDMPRSYAFILIGSILLVSQIAAANISDVSHLWIASSLLGLAYGSTSPMVPIVCIEWFGMRVYLVHTP